MYPPVVFRCTCRPKLNKGPAAVKQDGDALEYASSRLQDDESIVKAAGEQDRYALKYASLRLQDDAGERLQGVQPGRVPVYYLFEYYGISRPSN